MPTLGDVYVYLDNTACSEDRCGCPSDIASECCYNNCDWDYQPAPIIIVSEKSKSNTTFYVRRNIENYPYAIEIVFNITAVTPDIADQWGFWTRIEQIESGDYSETILNGSNDTATFANITEGDRINVTYTIPD